MDTQIIATNTWLSFGKSDNDRNQKNLAKGMHLTGKGKQKLKKKMDIDLANVKIEGIPSVVNSDRKISTKQVGDSKDRAITERDNADYDDFEETQEDEKLITKFRDKIETLYQ